VERTIFVMTHEYKNFEKIFDELNKNSSKKSVLKFVQQFEYEEGFGVGGIIKDDKSGIEAHKFLFIRLFVPVQGFRMYYCRKAL